MLTMLKLVPKLSFSFGTSFKTFCLFAKNQISFLLYVLSHLH